LYKYLGGIVRGEGGALIEVGGMSDHVHLLVRLKPTIALAALLRHAKANSSRWVNDRHARARKFGWQDSYAAFTVSESQKPRVVRYIRDQREHHARVEYQAEMLALLKRHAVEYDERYLCD
jgi:REP element-mobilizing transposase RayT